MLLIMSSTFSWKTPHAENARGWKAGEDWRDPAACCLWASRRRREYFLILVVHASLRLLEDMGSLEVGAERTVAISWAAVSASWSRYLSVE